MDIYFDREGRKHFVIGTTPSTPVPEVKKRRRIARTLPTRWPSMSVQDAQRPRVTGFTCRKDEF